MGRKIGSFLLDHPGFVTVVIVVAVVAQVVVSFWVPVVSPGHIFLPLAEAERSTAVADLALGVAGVAAMVGGFAGVVVVFGLSSDDERFRKVRLKAATSLQRNWTSVVTTPLVAAFGALVAATLARATWIDGAAWVLELCVLLAAHGAVRLVVVLFELVKVVHNSDLATQRSSDTADTDDVLG
ncbi:hypothetical protein [uncultured Microbacterium sp.]|uniref:hypothetical protein n=1 Tax=uncultured Microbacterium sp. TaxID=191216 RepID=UPI0025F03F58|nr:hypothetical protein [uncultured Microbacterium sp.]